MVMQELHRTTSIGEKYTYRFIFKQFWNHLKLFGLVFGLVVLFILTATPVYFYYVIPSLNSPAEIDSLGCHRIPTAQLNRSVCSTAFPLWNANENANRCISVSGCGNFSKAEKDVRNVTTLLPLSSDKAKMMSLFCHYAFNDSDEFDHIIKPLENQTICVKFRNLISLLETNLSCLTIPTCKTNSTEAICPRPLILARTKAAKENGVHCSPPCYQRTWKNGTKAFHVALCISLAIHWISVAITFATWAKMKKPFSHQSLTSFFLPASLAVFSISITIPIVLGAKRTLCKHESMIDSGFDPTTACHVQGLLLEFGYLSILMWWISSVSTTVLTVWKPEKFGHKSHKRLFYVQLTLSLLLPGGKLALTLIRGVKYAQFLPSGFSCAPTSFSWTFYTFMLPTDVLIMCGTVMSVFVVIKLHQAKKIHVSLGNVSGEERREIAEAYALIQKRFFLLSIFIPLKFASQMATDIIYRGTQFSKCFKQMATKRCLSEYEAGTGWLAVEMLNIIFTDLCLFAFVIYCLIPKPARIFWSDLWRKCKKRQFSKRCNVDMTERLSEVTRLFPSSTTRRELPVYSFSENSD